MMMRRISGGDHGGVGDCHFHHAEDELFEISFGPSPIIVKNFI